MHTSEKPKDSTSSGTTEVVYCTLPRRLMVMLYDSFAVLAVLFLISVAWVVGNSGEAITPEYKIYPLYMLSLWLATWFYFAISWRKGGLTLGMRAWHTRLVTESGTKISWAMTLIRYCAAWLSLFALATGFLISLLRKDRACLHDLLSRSRLIRD